MSCSSDPTMPTERNQEPRHNSQDPFLEHKETEEPRMTKEESSDETEKETSKRQPHETSRSYVPPMNKDQASQEPHRSSPASVSPLHTDHALTSQHSLFSENPNSWENMYGDGFSDASMDIYGNNSPMFGQHEGYGTYNYDPFPYQDNMPPGSRGPDETSLSYVSPTNTDQDLTSQNFENPYYFGREISKITMIPTPGYVSPNNSGGGFSVASMMHNPVTSVGASSSLSHQQEQVQQQPQWTIKKTLRTSDVSKHSRRLLLTKSWVRQHIQVHIPEADIEMAEAHGLTVNVYDHDTGTTHELCLALGRDYVLQGNWVNDFIIRREWKEGDEIGLLWNISASRLHFGVISREIAKPPAEEQKKL